MAAQVLRAKLAQVQRLVDDQEQWHNGCALLTITIERTCTQSPEFSVSLPNEFFMALQRCLQTGPLSGSKPGYFKRASLQTIETALVLLTITQRNSQSLGFSENQNSKLEEWIKAASKARDKWLELREQ